MVAEPLRVDPGAALEAQGGDRREAGRRVGVRLGTSTSFDLPIRRWIGSWRAFRTEIKFSTLWAKQFYKFQQIGDQNYEFLVCLGVSPFTAHAWVFEKQFLLQYRLAPGTIPSTRRCGGPRHGLAQRVAGRSAFLDG